MGKTTRQTLSEDEQSPPQPFRSLEPQTVQCAKPASNPALGVPTLVTAGRRERMVRHKRHSETKSRHGEIPLSMGTSTMGTPSGLGTSHSPLRGFGQSTVTSKPHC